MTRTITLPRDREKSVRNAATETTEDRPTTRRFLPYGRQCITEADIEAVTQVLRSDWLTQGPTGAEFEKELCARTGASHAVACANGTAALHLAMLALDIRPGDRVVTTPITFMADANCARYVGADVLFADIEPDTACMSADALESILADDTRHRIKAVIPVSFAGHPADLPKIYTMCREHGAAVVSDACHAIGGSFEYDDSAYTMGGDDFADLTVFSFHPVKHVAMGEGGAITTGRADLAERLRLLRNHGIEREQFIDRDMGYAPDGTANPWYHELVELGYNYRLSDIHAALGLSQLRRLDASVTRRREIAELYRELLSNHLGDVVKPLADRPAATNAYHLFVVRIDFEALGITRAGTIERLREVGIGTQVHYIPIHLQPYYRNRGVIHGTTLPQAEAYYGQALSLPMYPDLTDSDVEYVVRQLQAVLTKEP
ncbi:UDP-4-amino-4,6-dideoxy-N-acetyl-beta-L-altrosamine transaminase [candidate division GN15 bacterium]|nr:UDP-4-amino-4,6-dideoxy-N-acetyl-beta-L-altrosamine transaminase [candidate division GN15 bacterium]